MSKFYLFDSFQMLNSIMDGIMVDEVF